MDHFLNITLGRRSRKRLSGAVIMSHFLFQVSICMMLLL